jgi:DNA replication and repair protein RecF
LTVEIRFQRVSVRCLRNLSNLSLEAAPRLNVICGDNGQGKTSLLEALYLVATTRSFRTERLAELIQDGQQSAVVGATVLDLGQRREQRIVLGHGTRTVLIDGNKPARMLSYAVRTPVVVFHPGDLLLVGGPAAGRRRLLSRLAFFLRPSSIDHRRRYLRALRERQRILEDRGPRAADLDVYEQLMAEHGAELASAHAHASSQLIAALDVAFAELTADDMTLHARHLARGSEDPSQFAAELRLHRQTDRQRRRAGFGPHRDDLDLLLSGRPARRHASQGQQRILGLALKLAELECVRAARGAHPVLLLDDVSSELDPGRTGAVYGLLRRTQSQVFVTTTRPDLLAARQLGAEQRTDWVVAGGALRPA